MALTVVPKHWREPLLRVAFFMGVMGCGYLLLWIALPPRRGDAAPGSRPAVVVLRERLCKGVRIEPGRWRMIVIHHSATPGGNAARFHDYHLYERGWDGGLGYHFVIGNGHGSGDGAIEIGPRWLEQAWGVHARGHNVGSVGICLVGNFEDAVPTEAQMEALIGLVRCLMDLCGLAPGDVRLHGELMATACPGRRFPTAAFRAALAARTAS